MSKTKMKEITEAAVLLWNNVYLTYTCNLINKHWEFANLIKSVS